MSTPVQYDDRDPRLYAPPWARERPLPVAGQPQSISSPPVASALETPSTAPSDIPQSTWAPRMPKGGPNIACPPDYQVQPEFGGDIAMRALRRRLALQPDIVPQPPILLARDSGFSWISRLGFLLLAVGIASFGIAFMATSELQRPARIQDDRTALASGGGVSAERSREPARLVVEDGKVPANEPLPLGVSLYGAAGGEFIQLTGLATGTRLSAGAPVGSMGWRLMARDLASVMAHAPRDYIGAMDAAIDLRSASDTLLDSQVVRLEWISKQPTATLQASIVARPKAQPLEPDEVGRLVRRGEQLLQTGDISSARLALRRAAHAGSAAAALGMGATYDPRVLREMGVLGFAPNAGEAMQWYQKASEFGSSEAARRIERLRAAER